MMRRLVTASVVCGLAVALTAVPGAVAKKTVKQVTSQVIVSATPTGDVTTGATTAVNVSGNVSANSSCRKNRTIHFFYVIGGAVGATEVGTPVITGPNGDFSATLPPPTPLVDGNNTQVRAVVDGTLRTKVIKGKKKGANKGKKKGAIKKRKFNCLEGFGDSNVFATSDGIP